jgi:UDP:flavonoid glycosyltransferase YjiC (YdhE family)
MATILFVTIDAGGNTPPALAVAAALKKRGHRILFLGHARQRERIENAGFEFRGFKATRPWNRTERTSSARVVSDFVYAATDNQLARDFLDLAKEEGVDLAVVDCMLLSVVKAAASLRMPSAVLFHTFYAYWNGPWARGPVALLARVRGVNARAIWKSADLELVACDPVLDPAASVADPGRIWTGITEPASVGAPAAGDRPKILISLSTTWFPGQIGAYRRIVAAVANLPVDAIVTTGGMATAEQLEPPANVTVVPFADHAAILPTVAVVVCHGGHSTAMKAVASGVPLLVIPMHPLMDQPMIGAAIQDAGLGLTLKKRANSAAIRAAIVGMLADPRFGAAAADAANRQREAQGPRMAADSLLRLLDSREPSPTRG